MHGGPARAELSAAAKPFGRGRAGPSAPRHVRCAVRCDSDRRRALQGALQPRVRVLRGRAACARRRQLHRRAAHRREQRQRAPQPRCAQCAFGCSGCRCASASRPKWERPKWKRPKWETAQVGSAQAGTAQVGNGPSGSGVIAGGGARAEQRRLFAQPRVLAAQRSPVKARHVPARSPRLRRDCARRSGTAACARGVLRGTRVLRFGPCRSPAAVRRRRYAEAIADFSAALALCPSNTTVPPPRPWPTTAHSRTHRPVLCWVLTVGRSLAHSPQVLHNRAFVYRKLGEYSKAIGDHSKVRRSRRRCGQPAVAAQVWTAPVPADDRADEAFACL
jgi:hypothetical protein